MANITNYANITLYVPPAWYTIVCSCPAHSGGQEYATGSLESTEKEYGRLITRCTRCKKYNRFYSSLCRGCGKYYLTFMTCEHWTPLLNKCQECIDDGCSLPPIVQNIKPRPPATAEEIEAEVNALGSIEFDFEF